MPLSFLPDECSRSNALWNAFCTHNRERPHEFIDVIRVGEPGAPDCGTDDESLIKWAAANGRVIISKDKNTLAEFHDNYVSNGNETPGLLFIRDSAPTISEIVESVALIAHAGEPDMLRNRCDWIPFT